MRTNRSVGARAGARLGAAGDASVAAPARARRRRAERVDALHRGPLLPDARDDPWILEARERVRAKLARHLSGLARYWEAARDEDRAAACRKRARSI